MRLILYLRGVNELIPFGVEASECFVWAPLDKAGIFKFDDGEFNAVVATSDIVGIHLQCSYCQTIVKVSSTYLNQVEERVYVTRHDTLFFKMTHKMFVRTGPNGELIINGHSIDLVTAGIGHQK